MSDLRQRFYIEDCPVRGEVVHLEEYSCTTRLYACGTKPVR